MCEGRSRSGPGLRSLILLAVPGAPAGQPRAPEQAGEEPDRTLEPFLREQRRDRLFRAGRIGALQSGYTLCRLGVVDHAADNLFGQFVLINSSILHDEEELFARLGQEVDVLGWITIDEQEIGKRAFFHYT